jgi:hypothetical protein
MEPTEIDRAHAAMQDAPEDDRARLRFYERLADGTLCLLLTAEPTGDTVSPEVFAVEGGQFALVFDAPERLAAFVGGPAPSAEMPGRVLAGMLAGKGVGLALNPDVAPSAMLIPADAVDWLAATLGQRPEVAAARPRAFAPPRGLPDAVLTGLDRKLAAAAGLAGAAWLAGVTYEGGGQGHLLAFVGALPGAEAALAAAVGEAMTFSGVEAGVLDVAFLAADDPALARLARVGLRFDLPQVVMPAAAAAPGMDPGKPPRLR